MTRAVFITGDNVCACVYVLISLVDITCKYDSALHAGNFSNDVRYKTAPGPLQETLPFLLILFLECFAVMLSQFGR